MQSRDRALAKHLEKFLWNGAVAVCQVEQIGDGAVGELQCDRDVIGCVLCAVWQTYRSHAVNRKTDHGARPIHEMAELAHDTAAMGMKPPVPRDLAGINARIDRKSTRLNSSHSSHS